VHEYDPFLFCNVIMEPGDLLLGRYAGTDGKRFCVVVIRLNSGLLEIMGSTPESLKGRLIREDDVAEVEVLTRWYEAVPDQAGREIQRGQIMVVETDVGDVKAVVRAACNGLVAGDFLSGDALLGTAHGSLVIARASRWRIAD
jgi:hypothetical protein